MSNTPTESEFDKELDKIFDDYVMIGETFSTNPKDTKDIPYLKKAIKQAVDKHVIGEKPYYDDEDAYADEKRGMHNLIDEQHINLYGGDKK